MNPFDLIKFNTHSHIYLEERRTHSGSWEPVTVGRRSRKPAKKTEMISISATDDAA